MKTLDEVIELSERCTLPYPGDCLNCEYFEDETGYDCRCKIIADALHYLKEYRMMMDDIAEKRKTLEEKISHYCDLIKIETDHYERSKVRWAEEYRNIKDDYEALQDFWAESQANPPLTWGELKAMTGKPVWVELRSRKAWGLLDGTYVDAFGHDIITIKVLHDLWHLDKAQMGVTWQAYRKERE